MPLSYLISDNSVNLDGEAITIVTLAGVTADNGAVPSGSTSGISPTALPQVSGGSTSLNAAVVGSNVSGPQNPMKKPAKMRPGTSGTARALCSQDWCKANPRGTTAEFQSYDSSLTKDELQKYEALSATILATGKQMGSHLYDASFVADRNQNLECKCSYGSGEGISA